MACFASFFGDHAAVKKQTKKQQIKWTNKNLKKLAL
jgi:hypothetical protein